MTRTNKVFFFLTLSLFVGLKAAVAAEKLKTWDVFELSLQAKRNTANPYLEIPIAKEGLVSATFTATAGPAKG
ncbi:MAG TPA: hypothetical protein VEZ55_10495, partial [Chitinophagaceae bacterium]|nr:hypothetical protein [Chitinophagaceae bacterium]